MESHEGCWTSRPRLLGVRVRAAGRQGPQCHRYWHSSGLLIVNFISFIFLLGLWKTNQNSSSQTGLTPRKNARLASVRLIHECWQTASVLLLGMCVPGTKEARGGLELAGVTEGNELPMWVLGTGLECSVRASSALDHTEPSPQSRLWVILLLKTWFTTVCTSWNKYSCYCICETNLYIK